MDNKLFKISYSKNDIGNLSKLAEQILMEEIEALPEINEGDVNFHSMYLYDLGDKIEAKLLIRNGTNKQVNFQFLSFAIINENEEIILNQVIDLTAMSVIPSMHVRPYGIYFDKKNLKEGAEVTDKCKVTLINQDIKALNSKESNIGYLDEALTFEERTIIENHIKEMPPLVKDQVSLNVFRKDIDEQDKAYVILLISNSAERNAELGAFRIIFRNHLGIPQAIKKVSEGLSLSAQTTSAFKFIIENEDIVNPQFDIRICDVTMEA